MASFDGAVLPIAVDCMGGDRGSGEVVRGAVSAWRKWQIPLCLVGDEAQLLHHLKVYAGSEGTDIRVVHAPDVVEMTDSPSLVLRKKPQSSMRVAYKLVSAGEASSVVGPGNTGAMMGIGMYELGVFSGLARPAIATVIPKKRSSRPTVLIDSGANVECRAPQLVQFAVMGEVYSRDILGCAEPRIALLSNGEEKSKGTDNTRAAAYILESLSRLNYVGYVEGNDLPEDRADVVVCDGFVGNVLLKGMEGAVKMVVDCIREAAQSNWRTKLGLALARTSMKKIFEEKLDPAAYGGAPLLGLKGVSIVAHGGSDWRAIMNALRVADRLVQADLTWTLERAVQALEPQIEVG